MQGVLKNKSIPAAAKGLYAYIAFCGEGECPSVSVMINEMNMSKETFYRHINILIAAGVVEKESQQRTGGKFDKTIYKLKNKYTEVEKFHLSKKKKPPTTREGNTRTIDYQLVADMYNNTCMSFPRVTKLSEKRKKAIKARLGQGYTIDDFKTLFEKAQGSSFLKGGNERNWSANFDWLIQDGNFAKVLDDNYKDKQKENTQSEEQRREYNSFGL